MPVELDQMRVPGGHPMAGELDRPHEQPGGLRARLLQEELDRRFAAVDREIDRRLTTAEDAWGHLASEMERRFVDARRETGHEFASTIAMRVALQEELDRRFTELSAQLDRRFLDSERAVQAALAAAKEAVLKAEESANERFKSVNEFREQLGDQASTFMGQHEYAAAHQSMVDKLDAADKRLTERLGALELRLTSRLDTTAGHDLGEVASRAEARSAETLAATLKQAAVASPFRANLAAGVAILAVLISLAVLVLALTRHPLRRPAWLLSPVTRPRTRRRQCRITHRTAGVLAASAGCGSKAATASLTWCT